MRRIVKSTALALALVPALASAAILNSRHDLSSGSTAAVKSGGATPTDQTCIFCHTPHHSNAQSLIWNHNPTAAANGFAGTTLAGTTLPASMAATSPSRACVACHDGTIALGAVNNAGGGAAGTITMTGPAAEVTAGGLLVGAYLVGGASLANNHPVGIPYAGATYNTITSGVPAASIGVAGGFASVLLAGCTGGTPACTTVVPAANGQAIALFPAASPATATNVGVECGSCHEPHNAYPANSYFLRVSQSTSSICKACHLK